MLETIRNFRPDFEVYIFFFLLTAHHSVMNILILITTVHDGESSGVSYRKKDENAYVCSDYVVAPRILISKLWLHEFFILESEDVFNYYVFYYIQGEIYLL